MTACALFLAWVLADPPPGDAYRLPPIPVLRAACDFNRHYRCELERRLEWEPYHRGQLVAALREAEALYKVYDDAWGARPDYTCEPEVKRRYLRDYRLAVGREAYYRAELPPCVPTWRFNVLR